MIATSIKYLLRNAVTGAICGFGFVGLSYLLSRPVNDGEVVGAAITAAMIVANLNRGAASKESE